MPPTLSIADLFRQHFGASPRVCVLGPGRVNLIGEHIDYSGGHVLPIALGLGVRIALAPRADGQFRLRACGSQDAPYDGPALAERTDEPFWVNYLLGTVREFEQLGHAVPGLDAVVDGDIPRASGLSSSAAFEVATAWALQALLGTGLSRQEIALLGQRAENKFVGVNCGIMDQTASACGRAGHAMLLDCNTLDLRQVPLEFGDAVLLVAHSGVHRGLSASAYNQRRSKCEAAVPLVQRAAGRAMQYLCEASMDDLEAARSAMDDEMYRRARHAVAEEQRVRDATRALAAGDLAGFGRLLDESHASLRDDYEVSCTELDELTARIRSHAGAYGSRLTGAGFGGCTVSLVRADAADAIIDDLKRNFYAPRNVPAIAFTTTAHDGVRVL